jgi:hypothetical protein
MFCTIMAIISNRFTCDMDFQSCDLTGLWNASRQSDAESIPFACFFLLPLLPQADRPNSSVDFGLVWLPQSGIQTYDGNCVCMASKFYVSSPIIGVQFDFAQHGDILGTRDLFRATLPVRELTEIPERFPSTISISSFIFDSNKSNVIPVHSLYF